MATLQQREELHRTIWGIAEELRNEIDGWEFKSYVLGSLFYRFISENLTNYINDLQKEAGVVGFDYAKMRDEDAIIKEENLRPEETRKFIEQSFSDGYVTTTGIAITRVLPPMPIFGGGGVNREEKKNTVLEKLTAFFNKFFNV